MDRTDEQKKILEKQRQEMIEQKVRNKGRSERGVQEEGKEKRKRGKEILLVFIVHFITSCEYVAMFLLSHSLLSP